jgi:hypothetical protein
VARKCNFWLHFFHEKGKKKFIPLSWKIEYFIFKNINKIDEFASHFNNVSLKYVKNIKGFDPNKIFVEHMISVGFNNSFIHTTLNKEEEEGNNQGTLVHEVGDLETLLSTNELYKQKGKGPSERSSHYLVVTPKTTTSRSNASTAHLVRKIYKNNSSSGGEKNHPLEKIENSHKLSVRKKRKNLIQEEEDNLIENEIQRFSLDDMKLEVDIEKIFPTMEQPEIVTQKNVLLEVVSNEIFSEEESFTFQSVIFYKESKKLIVEIGDQKNKKENLAQRLT